MAATLASTAAAVTSARLSNGSTTPRGGGFAKRGSALVGSNSSSLRGARLAVSSSYSSASARAQRPRKGVVSPRNVSDSPVVGEACLDPDASRVWPSH